MAKINRKHSSTKRDRPTNLKKTKNREKSESGFKRKSSGFSNKTNIKKRAGGPKLKTKRVGNSPDDATHKKKEHAGNFQSRGRISKNISDVKSQNKNISKWKKKNTNRENADGEKSDNEIEIVSAHFSSLTSHMSAPNDETDVNTRKLVAQQNRKKKQSGGFQSMGLSHGVFTGVLRRGYKVPTPIQRKAIPLIMDGKDVVAMARTGSGKTAAFIIPMFEKLITHNSTTGARALILSPTRELALQTLKFTKELGKYTNLRAAIILGGDRMDDQFEAMHNNPDIIIATPGRLMHIAVEMELRLKFIEYVVFDEADRLFEMGFTEQLNEIIHRLPDSRQTLLFSATLPKMLVEFAKAGLHDPTLVRLDVDSKLSEHLQTAYFLCRGEDKAAALIHLLRNVITRDEQTVIFAATMHHVEYINQILDKMQVKYAYIYSSMDQIARNNSITKFTNKRCMVLVVTDVAARGIDIPMLDVAINYNFPAKSKLFVHRVGRVARAGRSGTAYSLVAPDEMAYLLDLHLFLGRSLNLVTGGDSIKGSKGDGSCGRVPRLIIDEGEELLQSWQNFSEDFIKSHTMACNAYKQYVKSRPAPSSESIRRVKQMDRDAAPIGVHPIFGKHNSAELERSNLLSRMKSYKPSTTIFEINSTNKRRWLPVMKQKRLVHERVIRQTRGKLREKMSETSVALHGAQAAIDASTQEDLEVTFKTVIESKPGGKRKRPPLQIKDEENYLPYQPRDFQSELGLSLKGNFEQAADSAVLDLTADNANDMRKQEKSMKWDRKKKRYVGAVVEGKNKKVKTESGTWIKSSYKSNVYKDWLKRSKMAEQERDAGESGDDEGNDAARDTRPGKYRGIEILGTTKCRWRNKNKKDELASEGLKPSRMRGGKLRNAEQIMKERRRKERVIKFQNTRKRKHEKSRNRK